MLYSKIEYIWSELQNKYIRVLQKAMDYKGPVARLKGASSQQDALAASQASFYNTMTADYNTTFKNQQSVLQNLQNTLNPIVAAGPNQFGYNTAEVNTLNSQAIQGTGQQYNNASQALKANQAAQGGGNAMLPSGVASQQAAALASAGANQASSDLLGIQQAGYQQGFNMYESALGGLENVAGQYNSVGMSGAASGAGNTANSEANAVQQANYQAQQGMEDMIGSAVGGAAGAMCPAKGSLFLLADGTEIPVEDLKVKDLLQGIDGEPQAIEEIQSGPLPVVVVKTEDGHAARNSTIHAFALPSGGFVVAAKALGKVIKTSKGSSKVISVEKDGIDTIYNVITDGSHTYRADGLWALGQGDGEREVDTETWTKISNRIPVLEG